MPLHRSLEDFLLLEHHAKHQATMLYLSQPPELRAQTGQTVVVRCERYDRGDRTDLGVFVLSDVHGTPMSREEMGDLRLQEGTWVVVNTLCNDEGQPRAAWELVRGRLGVISAISDAQITVQLQRLSFKPTPFRYPHRRTDLQPGQVYTLDEMVDDLNADKYLEACQHAASNPLYHWLSAAYTDPQAPKPLRVIRPSRLRAGWRLRTWRRRRSSPPASPRRNAPLSAATTPSRCWWCKGRLARARATRWAWRFWRAPGRSAVRRGRSGSPWRPRPMRR